MQWYITLQIYRYCAKSYRCLNVPCPHYAQMQTHIQVPRIYARCDNGAGEAAAAVEVLAAVVVVVAI